MRVIKLPRIEVADPNLISLPKSHLEDSTEIDLGGDGRHRPSVEVSGVYARLDTTEELDDSKVYRIILCVVVTPGACEDVDREKRALGIVSEIRKLLAQCSGINVEDADVASESEITLQDLRNRNMVRWDF
jgi:hypothetical protein